MKKFTRWLFFIITVLLAISLTACEKKKPEKDGRLFDILQINGADVESFELKYQKDTVFASVKILEDKPYFEEIGDFLDCNISFWDVPLDDYLISPISIQINLKQGESILLPFYSFEFEDQTTVMGVYLDGYLYRMNNQKSMRNLHVMGDLVRDPLYWFFFRYGVSAFGPPKEMIVENQGIGTKIPEVKTYRSDESYHWYTIPELIDAPLIVKGKIQNIEPVYIRHDRFCFEFHGQKVFQAAAADLIVKCDKVLKGEASPSIKVRFPFVYATEQQLGELILGESQKDLSFENDYIFFLQEYNGELISYDWYFGIFEIKNDKLIPLFNMDPSKRDEYYIPVDTLISLVE